MLRNHPLGTDMGHHDGLARATDGGFALTRVFRFLIADTRS